MSRIIPWYECNLPAEQALDYLPPSSNAKPGMTILDFTLEGAKLYRKTTDTLIVTTVVGNEPHVYPAMMDLPKPFKIIGGVKTAFITPFDNSDGWKTILDSVILTSKLTGSKEFVLENESALWGFNFHQEQIDLKSLSKSLSIFNDTDFTLLWALPDILPNVPEYPDREERTKELVETIHQTLPTAKFLTSYRAWPDYIKSEVRQRLRTEMRKIVGSSNMIERGFVTTSGFWPYPGYDKPCFTPASALEVAKKNIDQTMSIYPGDEWLNVGTTYWG